MSVNATQVIDVQSYSGVVYKTTEELDAQIYVKVTHACTGKRNVELQAWTTGKIDNNTRKSFVQRDVGVAIASNARFIANRLCKCLTQGDANVLNGMVVINMGIALSDHLEVNHAVTGNLIQHMV